MKTQRRRLNGESYSTSTLNQKQIILIDLDEGPAVNVHGLRFCGSVEPENADANCNGFWICYCLPAGVIQAGDLPSNVATIDDEDFLPYVWGVGCFTA